MSELEERLDRLVSRDEIRQLAFKYALAVDMRDIDAAVNLYVGDTRVSAAERGHQALKAVFRRVLRTFRATVHHVGNHLIEFDGPEDAHGVCYCRCEHEVDGGKWVTMYLYYLDLYRRIDGVWLFKRRAVSELYAVDAGETPAGDEMIRWPGKPARSGTWHQHFPSWAHFWANPSDDDASVGERAPPEKFIDTMRKGERGAIPPDFSWANG